MVLFAALEQDRQRDARRARNQRRDEPEYRDAVYGVLDRGYSLTTAADGSVVKDATTVKSGDVLTTRLAKGVVESVVH